MSGFDCANCYQSIALSHGYEEPDHGLCWECASEALDRVKAECAAHRRGRMVAPARECGCCGVERPCPMEEYEKICNFKPKADQVNALPLPLRGYIQALETRCDPAGDVAALTLLQDQLDQLGAENVELKAELVDERADFTYQKERMALRRSEAELQLQYTGATKLRVRRNQLLRAIAAALSALADAEERWLSDDETPDVGKIYKDLRKATR